ncbi:MAG: 4-hydroxythreonine-4-phosphate dehydrogenase PdxA [Oligoflexia bacterium]|nr:4-hydroxythreonine-4-phosphate dehydrogenase PdxA [Oligoflexia bacterium]
MIYVSQGHERSIGPEVFIKSYLSLKKDYERSNFIFVCFKKSLEDTLLTLDMDFEFWENGVFLVNKKNKSKNFLKCIFVDLLDVVDNESSLSLPQSTRTLTLAINQVANANDVLLTLPTSKDQLILNGVQCKGYTEFFRSFYNNPSISMLFAAKKNKYVLLITDHIPLREVCSKINSSLIHQKVGITVNNIKKYFKHQIKRVIFAGINPHAGENGLLGDEEKEIYSAVTSLSREESFKDIELLGPYSGDALTFYSRENSNDLLVYMFHDQALSYFKSKYGFLGLNITLGLPFLRMSVDHGTAFELYGKNQADYLGATYLLRKALLVS